VKNANPVSSFLRLLAVLAAFGAVTGCGRGDAAREQVVLKTVADFFPIMVDGQRVQMQIAVRLDEMQHGLMDRRDLKPDQGMLFVYERPQQQSFWMRHTPTPLDVGFFNANGELEEIYPMYPFDETPVRSRSEALKFALEMNQGWFSAHQVKPGAKLDLKALAAALAERGFDPRSYGLEK
jgi:hypothetical protein